MKFVFKPTPTILVRVATNGGLEILLVSVLPATKVIGLMLGLSHSKKLDFITSQVKVTSSPLHANRLLLAATLEFNTTLPATKDELA